MTNHGTFNINSNPKYVFLGVQMKILMTPAQTRGQFGLIEGTMPPGGDGGLHVHHREDECMLILEGTLEVTIGHDTRTLTMGDSYFAPRAVPHRIRNPGPGSMRALMISTPGEFTSFITEVGVELRDGVEPEPAAPPTANEMRRIGELSKNYGIEMISPPGS
jgi:mannose-6-phosphate isomerase-like protein (cupin superfamily)